ncbi:hypothetical protein QEN19_001549 [Hanseniaspora menglaensis]
MFWDIGVLEALYTILQQAPSRDRLTNGTYILEQCVSDLNHVLITSVKNQHSRSKVESGKVVVHDIEYDVSQAFIFATVQLSDELNIDELIICEFLLNISERKSSINELLITQESLVKEGRLAYFLRRQYLLQILNYIFNFKEGSDLLISICTEKLNINEIGNNLIKSLESIHNNLSLIQESISRDTMVNQYDSIKKNIVQLKREFLKKEYDLLAQILTGFLLNKNSLYFFQDNNFHKFFNLLDFVESNLVNNDVFLLYFLPVALQFGNLIPKTIGLDKSESVWFLLDNIGAHIKNDEKLYMHPFRVLIYFNILINVVEWFKEDPSRTNYNLKNLDFEKQLKTPIYKLVLLGAIEEMMIFASTTSLDDNNALTDDFALIRDILEKHLPKLMPFQLQDVKMPVIEMTGHILKTSNTVGNLQLSEELKTYFIVNSLNTIIVKFIEHCPFILNQLRDEEEQALIESLSGGNLNDGVSSPYNNNSSEFIYKKADLERFFMTCYYVYNGREELGLPFWEDKDSALNGFIKWGSNCKDSLMTSCYYIMISAFANNKNLSKIIFQFVLNGKELGVSLKNSQVNGLMGNNSGKLEQNYFDSLATIIDDFSQAIQEWESGKKDITSVSSSNMSNDIFNRHSNLGRHQFSSVSQHLKNWNTEIKSDLTANRSSKLITYDDLNEEATLLLTALISFIGKLSNNLEVEEKETLANIFTNILFQLLSLNTPLVGVILRTISSFVTEKNRNDIWDKFDLFIFNTSGGANKTYSKYYVQRDEEKFIINPQSLSYTHFFKSQFKDIKEVFGFLSLLKTLTFVTESLEYLPLDELLLPLSFGVENRGKKGIAPYLEYLVNDLLINSEYINDFNIRNIIQIETLFIIENCLKTFDHQKLIDLNFSMGTNLDLLVEQNTFAKYLMELPATYAMSNLLNIEENWNFLFGLLKDKKSQNIILDINQKDKEVEKTVIITNIIAELLKLDDVFSDIILPLVKESLRASKDYYTDKSIFEYNSIRSFKDCIRLDNLLVIDLMNNLSHPNVSIGMNCIDILSGVCDNKDERQLRQLLETIQNTEDSVTLKQNLMYALDTPVNTFQEFEYKLKLLKFLNDRVNSVTKVTQWIVGVQLKPGISLGPEVYQTFISSNVSVFGSVIKLIVQSLNFISSDNVPLVPMRLLAAAFELLNNLVVTDAELLVDYLQDIGFIEELIKLTVIVDKNTTLWDSMLEFDELSSYNNSSFVTILNFLKFRAHFLEFLGVVVHQFRNTTVANDIVKLLMDSNEKIFKLLDILKNGFLLQNHHQQESYEMFSQMYLSQLELYKTGVNFEPVLKKLKLLDYNISSSIFDFKPLDSLLDLRYQWLKKTANNSRSIAFSEAYLEQDKKERKILKNNIIELNGKNLFNSYQKEVVHNWNALVQLIVTDGNMTIESRNNFILKTFQTLINEIEILLDSNMKYAEEFISLIVVLYDILETKSYNVHDKNLYKLFITATQGIISPLTTISMRSDLYVIINKYLTTLMEQEEEMKKLHPDYIESILKKLTHDLKMLDEKLVEIIVSDCINGSSQGSERITSVLFLKTLIRFGFVNNGNKSNFIVKSLSNTTMLLSLIRSLKNLDELISNEDNNDNYDVSFKDVKYELTVFKFTMNLLYDIAATKIGAYELLQNDIMSVINRLRFDAIDLNMGTQLEFKEFINLNQKLKGEVRIKLDSSNFVTENDPTLISVFEILTPIFKLVATILTNLGAENKQLKISINKFLLKHDQQIKNLLKRDSLLVEHQHDMLKPSKYSIDLQNLINLIIILFNE